MEGLAENQKDVEHAPWSQNRKVRAVVFDSVRDDYGFKEKPRYQNANREPVYKVEIRGNRKHYREKESESYEGGVHLLSYCKMAFRAYAFECERENCGEAERRHDVGDVQEEFPLCELIPKKRGRDSFHAKLIYEKENRSGENERRVFVFAKNPNEYLRANRNQKQRHRYSVQEIQFHRLQEKIALGKKSQIERGGVGIFYLQKKLALLCGNF